MKTELHAEEIYNYCEGYMLGKDFITDKVKKEMIKEIVFLIDNS